MMYLRSLLILGQALKDLLKVPRPQCPPVVRLDNKWVLEYGLPSTHAMVAMSVPFSILILSVQRYQVRIFSSVFILGNECVKNTHGLVH